MRNFKPILLAENQTMVKITALAFLGGALASPIGSDLLGKRQSCPNIHVFGARETTASPGYGSSATVVNDILNAYPGSTAEAINYPACGGQSSCGGDSYSQSVQAGFAAAANAVNSFNSRCPNTQLVLVGYSQVWRSVLFLPANGGIKIHKSANGETQVPLLLTVFIGE